MDLIMKQGAQLAPKDTAEAIGVFRAQVIDHYSRVSSRPTGNSPRRCAHYHASVTGRRIRPQRGLTRRPLWSVGTTASKSAAWPASRRNAARMSVTPAN
jgi:hypothetical protein